MRSPCDHPWVSLSVILKGGYVEHTATEVRRREAGSIIFRRAKHAHRIELLREGFCLARKVVPAWTIFITGPKIRDWGFHCPQGWRHWTEFVAETDSGNVGKGCEP